LNWAASGAAVNASRAPIKASTLTPLLTAVSALAVGINLLHKIMRDQLSCSNPRPGSQELMKIIEGGRWYDVAMQ
jgi:hypothetical protein